MAECHPVGFQWVMEAKARGAKVIHIDPRFTRTSAVADMHVPLRAGSDIAFLGGIVNHILSTEKFFHDYVVSYTNASVILRKEFRDVDDLDGVFSGYDPETGTYDPESWAYEGVEGMAAPGSRTPPPTGEGAGHGAPLEHGEPQHDLTLQDPRCVFQVLKRHYARYTPEMVSQTCGVSVEQFLQVCEDVTANSGRERTTAWVYSVGWTHHSVGVQYIRGAAIIQLLLGNMGRPGGGILALRGHASIQGSTDIPTLFNLLPGYLPMPKVGEHDTLDAYLETVASEDQKGFWANARDYTVSLLKAYWGDAATPENAARRDHHQVRHQVRPGQRHTRRDLGAHGMAHHGHPAEAELLHQGQRQLRKEGRVAAGRDHRAAPAEAGEVRRVDLAPHREQLLHPAPPLGAGPGPAAVQQQHGVAGFGVAGAGVAEVHVQPAQGHGALPHHRAFPRARRAGSSVS